MISNKNNHSMKWIHLMTDDAVDIMNDLVLCGLYVLKDKKLKSFDEGSSTISCILNTGQTLYMNYQGNGNVSFYVDSESNYESDFIYSISPLPSYLKYGSSKFGVMESIADIARIETSDLHLLDIEPDYLIKLTREVNMLGFEFINGMKIHGVIVNCNVENSVIDEVSNSGAYL